MTADTYNELVDEEDDSVESRNTAGHAFEDQETEDEPTVIGAFQPMLFSTSTRRVRDLNSDYTNQELDPRPSFQRGYVWDLAKASRLSESVLLNVPLPLIYTAEESDSNKEVVIDGQQRLLTLFGYIKGQFPRNGRPFRLKHLKILSDLNGKLFSDLDDSYRTKILRYDMTIIKIGSSSDPNVKFEIFERLNSGSVSLNPQELRNCIYRGRFNDLLRELTQYPNFRKAIASETLLERMLDAELVLRFLAFYERTYLNFPGGIKSFLNDFMNDYCKNISPEKQKKFTDVFKQASDLVFSVFGENSFRRFSLGTERSADGRWERTVNRALYDIIMWGFTQYDKNLVMQSSDSIRSALVDLCVNDDNFKDSITAATNDRSRVNYRFITWKNTLDSILAGNMPHNKRLFSYELKVQMYARKQDCALCGQRVHTIDDCELDHIVPFSQGGLTVPENAQVTHRYCNRKKGRQG
jgi:hypothetical protein